MKGLARTLGAILIALPAFAGPQKDCTQTEDWWLRIAACTKAIDSGTWPGAQSSWAFSNRAVAHAALGNYLAAFDDHEAAVRLDPANATARNNKANSHADFREYDRAIAEYSAAIALRPGYLNAHFNRAGVYFATGQIAEAVADYDIVIAGAPEFADAYAGRAEASCRAGDVIGSVADRSRALDLGALTRAAVAGYLSEKGYLDDTGSVTGDDAALTRALTDWTEAGCP